MFSVLSFIGLEMFGCNAWNGCLPCVVVWRKGRCCGLCLSHCRLNFGFIWHRSFAVLVKILNTLIINNLQTRFFAVAKQPISQAKTGRIAMRNGLNRKAVWPLSENGLVLPCLQRCFGGVSRQSWRCFNLEENGWLCGTKKPSLQIRNKLQRRFPVA